MISVLMTLLMTLAGALDTMRSLDPLLLMVVTLAGSLVLADLVLSLTGILGGGIISMALRRLRAGWLYLSHSVHTGRKYGVVLLGFDRRGERAALDTVEVALHSRLGGFLFDRGVDLNRFPIAARDVADMAEAGRWMQRCQADMVVWGGVSEGRFWQVLVMTREQFEARRPAYAMRIAVPEHGEERQRLAAAIAFLAGRLALPVAEQADRYRPERLRAYLERLEELSRSLPEGLGAGLGRLVRDDLAAIALSIGQRDGDSALLAKAGHWRLRALNEIDPVTRQVAWRQARAALGQTYFALGTAEASVRRLRSALTAMKDAVVEDDHALAPQLRASLLVDIGRVHRALGEMGDGDVSAHFLDATIAFRQAMTLARDLPEETPEQRVQRRDLSLRAQRNLANVLHILSDIERDDAMLDEAIAHYRDTLTDGARARDISGWSKAQHGLGMALNAHGARHGLAISFEQAQAAFAEALHGRNREEAPAAWAETQNQLGHAAYGLGKLKRDPREFERAIACYRAALQERTPDGDPYHWAQAQNNIGNAYQAMAQISRSEAHMEAAIKAYYKALTALDRDRNPGEWGGTQNNLGNTLHALGERREGTELLEDALRALRAALMVRTREARPLDWAATRSNMGLVHMTIGARQRSTQRLARATAAFREALEVFEAMGADHYAQMSRASLADLQSIEARLAADASR